MSRPLDGVRVAITENRYPEQLTQLLERFGATVFSCPLLKETPIENAAGARRFMSICENTEIDYVVFYTGVGVDFLFRAVNKPDVLAKSKILARGPKAVNALKRVGLQANLVADTPTTEGILKTLSREPLHGKTVLIQLYGNDNPGLLTSLQKLGATPLAVSIYSYSQASDSEAVKNLIQKVINKEIDVITFTSAMQVPFLLSIADTMANPSTFRQRLKKDIVVVSVGEVTSRALRDAGVQPKVEPTESKMGPMVRALAEYFEKGRR